MFNGFVVFGICSIVGLWLLWRGLTDDTADHTGISNGSRWWWIIGGVLMQLPLIAYTLFAQRQGFFGN